MAESKKRIALKPHMEEIREWVQSGKTDEWIADALGTSPSSVQSFRSRNDIYRRERGDGEPHSVFEGVLDHGENEGWGLWLDPSVAEDRIWRESWAGVESVTVKISDNAIVLEADGGAGAAGADSGVSVGLGLTSAADETEETENGSSQDDLREQGRVKWFDPEKGYGFLVRPTGEDIFFHHSEIQGKPSDLEPRLEVSYEVGHNDRGPNARRVRLLG